MNDELLKSGAAGVPTYAWKRFTSNPLVQGLAGSVVGTPLLGGLAYLVYKARRRATAKAVGEGKPVGEFWRKALVGRIRKGKGLMPEEKAVAGSMKLVD